MVSVLLLVRDGEKGAQCNNKNIAQSPSHYFNRKST